MSIDILKTKLKKEKDIKKKKKHLFKLLPKGVTFVKILDLNPIDQTYKIKNKKFKSDTRYYFFKAYVYLTDSKRIKEKQNVLLQLNPSFLLALGECLHYEGIEDNREINMVFYKRNHRQHIVRKLLDDDLTLLMNLAREGEKDRIDKALVRYHEEVSIKMALLHTT